MCNLTAVKDLPSPDELWELFDYDPLTGDLTIKETGHICGQRRRTATNKHIIVHIDGSHYLAHRVIWTMVNGQIPEGMTIDHANLDKRDNRISNLRLATSRQQMQNRKTWAKTGIKGVYINKRGLIFSSISINGRLTHIGTFGSIEEAAAAYEEAAYKYQGQFARPTSVASAA